MGERSLGCQFRLTHLECDHRHLARHSAGNCICKTGYVAQRFYVQAKASDSVVIDKAVEIVFHT